MKNIDWVVEVSEAFSDGERVAEAAKAAGRRVHVITDYMNAPWPRIQGIPVCYGSVNCILRMSRTPSICEGVFDWHERLRCSSYYHHANPGFRMFVPFGMLKDIWGEIYSMFGEKVFIRPDSSIKEFDGRVINTIQLKDIDKNPELNRASGGMVVIGRVQNMGNEYRIFCLNGEAVCSSSYKPTGEYKPAPKDVIAFAEDVAKKLIEPVGNMVAVDVFSDPTDRGWQRISKTEVKDIQMTALGLIEINGVNSAGLYGCDVMKFIEAMEAQAMDLRS